MAIIRLAAVPLRYFRQRARIRCGHVGLQERLGIEQNLQKLCSRLARQRPLLRRYYDPVSGRGAVVLPAVTRALLRDGGSDPRADVAPDGLARGEESSIVPLRLHQDYV